MNRIRENCKYTLKHGIEYADEYDKKEANIVITLLNYRASLAIYRDGNMLAAYTSE